MTTAAATPPFVELDSISRRFGEVVAVRGVDLALRRGEIVALLGPSGCGKSTLLRIVAGLEATDGGDVRIDGRSVRDLPPYRRPVNMMFQSYALFPHLTVEQNVEFGLRQAGLPREQRERQVQRMLELVRMGDYRRRRPSQLSGGQQQRVALARSLAREPQLLLLDEPMGALDRKLRAEMQFELAEILRQVGVTCLMVTHDPEEAMVMADRIALMNEGEVVQAGSPTEVYSRPRNRFAAEFLGPVNFFAARVQSARNGTVSIDVQGMGVVEVPLPDAGGLRPGQAVTMAWRPEQLRMAGPAPGAPAAVLEDWAFLGTHTTCRLKLEGQAVTVHCPGPPDAALEAGSAWGLAWEPDAPRLLLA